MKSEDVSDPKEHPKNKYPEWDMNNGPIAERRDGWTAALREIRSKPLTLCPNFPDAAQRWNDWWSWEGERPLLIPPVVKRTDIRWDKAFDLIDRPEEWLQVRRAQVENMHYIAELLPSIRIDIGPVALAAFVGAPLHLALKEQTSWQDPIIKEWDNRTSFKADPGNVWMGKVLELMALTAEDARGNYLVCTPDLTGAIDALANMRTPQRLCMDIYDHREEILDAAAEVVDAWEWIFAEMYDRVLQRGAGITEWITCWADSPFTVPTCDFNALVSPDDFSGICLPSLSEQARRAGLCVFHLDGPDAARHAETLALDPNITAIEYVPGAATPSPLAKMDMFKMFQSHQVPLFLEVPKEEVERIVDALDPRGLAIRVHGLKTPSEADELFEWLLKRFP